MCSNYDLWNTRFISFGACIKFSIKIRHKGMDSILHKTSYRKITWDRWLVFSDCSEIWQHCCWGTCQFQSNMSILTTKPMNAPFKWKHEKHWWLNSLWPSATIWRCRTESTLTQVMAWCRQYWINIDLLPVRSNNIHLRAISQEKPRPSITKISLKITPSIL